MDNRKQTVLVALQQALLGEVSARLRAITVVYNESSIHFDCYYDGEIFDEDKESMSSVETELLALFPEQHRISYHVLRRDFPESIPKDRTWVYYRKENAT